MATRYEEVALDHQRYWFVELQLGLGVWSGCYGGVEGQWLRWYDAAGNWLATPTEQAISAQQQAEQAQQQAEQERQRPPSRNGNGPNDWRIACDRSALIPIRFRAKRLPPLR